MVLTKTTRLGTSIEKDIEYLKTNYKDAIPSVKKKAEYLYNVCEKKNLKFNHNNLEIFFLSITIAVLHIVKLEKMKKEYQVRKN
jgi:hypothetical protein